MIHRIISSVLALLLLLPSGFCSCGLLENANQTNLSNPQPPAAATTPRHDHPGHSHHSHRHPDHYVAPLRDQTSNAANSESVARPNPSHVHDCPACPDAPVCFCVVDDLFAPPSFEVIGNAAIEFAEPFSARSHLPLVHRILPATVHCDFPSRPLFIVHCALLI
jgi:hypothetical protein